MTATVSSQSKINIPPLHQWHPATWQDYVALRDAAVEEQRIRLGFNQGWLWIDMGGEGINHSSVCDLFTTISGFWAIQHPDEAYTSLGRCLLEKQENLACAPDLVLYIGENYPHQSCTKSLALKGLPISVLEETLQQLSQGTNTSAAAWFTQQISNLGKQ